MTIVKVITESFTHNNFKTYDTCKRKYYYEYIKKLHWPDLGADFEIGLSVHKLLDYQAKGFETTKLANDSRDEIKELWQYISVSDIITYPVIESEWAFNVRINKSYYWIEGRIDRLIHINDINKYVIIDFKTGQNLPSSKHEDWQSIVYLYSVSVAKDIKPEELEFWYYKVEQEPEIRKIQHSSELQELFQAKIFAKIEEIKNTKVWEPNKECRHKFCQYKELCQRSSF